MVMLRKAGKAEKIAQDVMRRKGVEVRSPKSEKKEPLKEPYLQH